MILANSCNVAGHVVIEDHVIIEGMVGIQQFVRIGKHAFIAGGSLVRKNVPPYIKAARSPELHRHQRHRIAPSWV